MSTLYQISDDIRYLMNLLESGEATDENGEINEVVIEQLQISQAELEQKGINYCYAIKELDNKLDNYKSEIARLNANKKQIENAQERMKNALKDAMVEFGIEKLEGKTISVKLTKSKSVDVYDMTSLPTDFHRQKITIEPDKVAIKEAINNGQVIEGAHLKENINLRIK